MIWRKITNKIIQSIQLSCWMAVALSIRRMSKLKEIANRLTTVQIIICCTFVLAGSIMFLVDFKNNLSVVASA
jgi:hypothetical protein